MYCKSTIKFLFFLICLIYSILKLKFTLPSQFNLQYKSSKVKITRDKLGVPYINASDQLSFQYGLGYAQASDRLFQMNVRRMLSSGRISEMIGKKTLDVDIFFRQLGFKYWSDETQKKIKKQNPQFYQQLSAYVDGINDFVEQNGLPFEFYVLWINFDKWTISDSVVVSKIIHWSLSMNVQQQYVRSFLLKNFTVQQVRQIFPYQQNFYFFGQNNTVTMDDSELDHMNISHNITKKMRFTQANLIKQKLHSLLSFEVVDYMNILPEIDGSNAWIISGDLTESGYPILANDPHLQNSIPSQWYPLQFQFNNKKKSTVNFRGFIIAGTPHLLMGKSNYFSFGCTNSKTDVQDLYLEQIKNNLYLFEGKWINLNFRKQIIKIKGEQPLEYQVRSTHRGPILSKLFARGREYNLNDPLSLAWTGFTNQYNQLQGFAHFYQQNTIQDINQQLTNKLNQGPSMNLFYITKDNHIGYTVLGRIPIRENPQQGAYIKDGTVSKHDWNGFIIGGFKPNSINPKRGYLINSNNKPVSVRYANGRYAYDVTPTARANRIEQLIQQKIKKGNKISVQDMKMIQKDTIDIYCRQLLPKILKLVNESNLYLKQWNCGFSQDSYEASIYTVFINKLKIKKNKSTLPISDFFNYQHFIYRYLYGNSTYQIDQEQLNFVFKQTLSFLSEKFKTQNYKNWNWGKLHVDYLPFPILTQSFLSIIFDRKQQGRGNINTITMGLMLRQSQDSYNINIKPNFRMICSYAQNSSYWISDCGVSGSILSNHFDDQMNSFAKNEYFELKFSSEYKTEDNSQL